VPAPCGVSAGAKRRHNARRSQLSVIAAGRRRGGGNHAVTARLAAHSAIQRDSPAIRVVGMDTDSSPSEPQIHPEPVGHRPIRRPDRGSGGVRLLSLLPRRRRGLLGASGDCYLMHHGKVPHEVRAICTSSAVPRRSPASWPRPSSVHRMAGLRRRLGPSPTSMPVATIGIDSPSYPAAQLIEGARSCVEHTRRRRPRWFVVGPLSCCRR
jgi:hypothetical protein